MSLERTSRLIPLGVSGWTTLLTHPLSVAKGRMPAQLWRRRETSHRSEVSWNRRSVTWLAPLGAGSGESYEMNTIHHRARPPSPFEGARTTEVRLDRHRGCSCAVVASSPTLAFFLSHPSRESAPPLLSAKLCLDPPLSFCFSLFLFQSRVLP